MLKLYFGTAGAAASTEAGFNKLRFDANGVIVFTLPNNSYLEKYILSNVVNSRRPLALRVMGGKEEIDSDFLIETNSLGEFTATPWRYPTSE